MTCRDCIHFNACYKMAMANNAAEFNTLYAEKCEDFQDRSAWVKLPCKVGDILYEPADRDTISEYEVTAVRVELFSIFVEWKNTVGFVWRYVHEINSNEIGKTVFLIREDAERALQDRSGE